MKALVTGFDAFGGASSNPSSEIARLLAQGPAPPPLAEIEAMVLPTDYAEAPARLCAKLRESRPDLVVMFGLAARSREYRLERFALNVADAEEPDNSGSVQAGRPVIETAPPAYRTGLDLGAIARRTAELTMHRPVVSNHAGAFVCNCTYFSALHEIAASRGGAQALFVHVPWSLPAERPEELLRPPLDVHVETARALLKAIGETAVRNVSAA